MTIFIYTHPVAVSIWAAYFVLAAIVINYFDNTLAEIAKEDT